MATGTIKNPLSFFKNPIKLSNTNVTSDTYILSLPDGVYQVADGSTIPYIPTNYGTLLKLTSGNQYGFVIFVSTSSQSATQGVYVRSFTTASNSWHYVWKRVNFAN